VTDTRELTQRASLWGHRDFLLLWGGQTVSEAGSSITRFALPLAAVVAPLSASTFEIGLLSATASLAFLVVALPAGVVVDRLPRRQLMIWSDVARMVIIAAIPLAYALGVLRLWQLFAVALAAGVCTVFFDVAYQSYLPTLVDREQLAEGNGKLGATQSLANVSGPVLGSGLVALVGAAGALAVDVASYAVSLLSLSRIRTREPVREPAAVPATRTDRRAEFVAGLSYVVRHPILRKVVACTGVSNLFDAISAALMIVFAVRVLHVRPAAVGLLLAAGALGGILGGVLSGRLTRAIGSARLIWVSALVFGAVPVLLPLAQPGGWLVLFVLGNAGYGLSAVLYNTAQISYRQSVCPPELLGRVNAAVRWLVWGTLPVGGLLGGVLGATIGIRPAIWVAVLGAWAGGLFVFFSPLRHLRDIPAQP